MSLKPEQIALIGNEVAIKWNDGEEDFFPMDFLRAASPSADTMGEKDIFGNVNGGSGNKEFPGVVVHRWEMVGGYAIRFIFSDRHNTGLYSFDYLRQLGVKLRQAG